MHNKLQDLLMEMEIEYFNFMSKMTALWHRLEEDDKEQFTFHTMGVICSGIVGELESLSDATKIEQYQRCADFFIEQIKELKENKK